ncbi:MAG: SRPBCC domain-containing protein [Candidatus Tectomicrobia bacterium]|uniref:SRPBCC domain-containing protein n=1 Tax=Tectimicrobiota bacterium TaxID=2528274 RepID=A0A932MLX6_UNCTE|nr:SRPBCC domain-containing protein [Candidatus Tectomicrobia bacterium]
MPALPARALHTLRLVRTFEAPRERVFRAWTDPEALKEWYGPDGWSTPSAEVDLRAGGGYRITMKGPEGEEIRLSGTFREVRPPERLVYTWNWEKFHLDLGGLGETLVTVEFHERGGATELILTHERFPRAETRDLHGGGWASTLDCLAEYLG